MHQWHEIQLVRVQSMLGRGESMKATRTSAAVGHIDPCSYANQIGPSENTPRTRVDGTAAVNGSVLKQNYGKEKEPRTHLFVYLILPSG